MRCIKCGTRIYEESSGCPICTSDTFEYDQLFTSCMTCQNMYYRPLGIQKLCPYCGNNEEIAKILSDTFPWQNDTKKRDIRQALFRYIVLRNADVALGLISKANKLLTQSRLIDPVGISMDEYNPDDLYTDDFEDDEYD